MATATRRPPEEFATRRELAKIFGISMSGITKMEQAGMPVHKRGRRGKPSIYKIADAKGWKNAREAAAKTGQILDFNQERARKERAQAVLAEQTVAMRAERLVRADDVEREWSTYISAVRAKILSWPTTLTDRIHRASALKGRGGVESELKAVANEILLELADVDEPVEPAARPSRKTTRKK